jgi:hypothetical protein
MTMRDGDRARDALREALRLLADDDAGRGASVEVEARLWEAVRAIGRADRRQRPATVFLGLAAALIVLVGSAWRFVATHPTAKTGPAATMVREVATEFLPLTYGHLPVTDAYIVRLEVPRSALVAFGLATPDLPVNADETIDADVLVGMDGLARAVRFVHQVSNEE